MRKAKKEATVIEDNLKILDIRYYDGDIDAFVLEDGSYLDFLEVLPKDRDNADEDELQHDIYTMMRFYKLSRSDIKWISLNFPVNASKQKECKERRIERTNDPIRKKWLQRHIAEFDTVESNITRREFFLMIFGDNKEIFIKNRKNALDVLGYGRNRMVKPIDGKKKIQIEFKLNNMNSLIVVEDNRK